MRNEEKIMEIIKENWPYGTSISPHYKNIAYDCMLKIVEWKEQQIFEKLKEMDIEDGDIEDFANEEQSSNYGLSEKFILRLKNEMEE